MVTVGVKGLIVVRGDIIQTKRSDNVQVSTASMQFQPTPRANVTQLRPSVDDHARSPSTGYDVTGSSQRQPEVLRPLHVGAAESFEASTEGVRASLTAEQEVPRGVLESQQQRRTDVSNTFRCLSM